MPPPNMMVNDPLIRPYFGVGIGGGVVGPLDSHDYSSTKQQNSPGKYSCKSSHSTNYQKLLTIIWEKEKRYCDPPPPFNPTGPINLKPRGSNIGWKKKGRRTNTMPHISAPLVEGAKNSFHTVFYKEQTPEKNI